MYLVRSIAFLIVALIAGLIGYQIGVTQNIAAQIPAGAAAPAYWYGPHMYGWGFGFLGFLFPILFFFLFVGLISAAVRGGRGWGGHGWYGHGPMGEHRRAHFEELHRELHGDKPSSGGPSTST